MLMLNYGMFTNFLFCRSLNEKKIIPTRKQVTGQSSILCRDTVLECCDRIPNDKQELCRNKDQTELKPEIKVVAT